MKKIFGLLNISYVYAFCSEATLGLIFLLYIYLARILGPEQYGVFSAATALGGILAHFIQFGFPPLLTREIAANPSEEDKALGAFLIIELLNSLPIFLFLYPLAYALGFSRDGIIVCFLVIFSEVFRALKMTLRGVLKGHSWFGIEAITVGLERLFTTLVAGAVLFLTQSLIWVVVAIILVRLVDTIGLVIYLSRQIRIKFSLDADQFVRSLKVALPFAASNMLWVVFYQVDVIMLQMLSSPEEAGLYGASYRLMEIFSTLPKIIFAVTFTKVVRCYATNPQETPREIYKLTCLILLLIVPFLLVAGSIQPFLVSTIYGKTYLPAVKSLSVLLPTVSVVMLSEVANQVLLATGKEKKIMTLLFVTVIFNLVANAILIPYIGASGSAIATLLSELMLALLSLRLIIQGGFNEIGQRIRGILLVGLLTTALPSLVLNGMNLFVGIALMIPCLIVIAKFSYPYLSQVLKEA